MMHQHQGQGLLFLGIVCLIRLGAASTEITVFRGFPAAIRCSDGIQDANGEQPDANQTVKCIIIKNNEVVLFDDAIQWNQSSVNGYFFDVTDEWNMANITITIDLEDRTNSTKLLVLVEEIEPPSRSSKLLGTVGTSTQFACTAKRQFMGVITEEQFNSIETTWRKDGKDISNDDPLYQYKPTDYSSSKFQGLEILNSTYENTPGAYDCVITYKGAEATLKKNSYCVKAKPISNEPNIKTQQEKYSVQLGDSQTFTCHGTLFNGDPNILVFWKIGGEKGETCLAIPGQKGQPCSVEVGIVKFCEPASSEEIIEAERINQGNFTSTFTKTNITENDIGGYGCQLRTTGVSPTAYFNVTLKEPETYHHLEIALGVVAGIIAFFILVAIICYWKRLEIKYLKKKFEKPIETDQPVTYLVYSADVGQNPKGNPLDDVIHSMKELNYKYYDPNKGGSDNDVGVAVVQHSKEMVEKCLSMTIFLSSNLIDENELEILRIYEGFQDSIKRNFPIVFICTEEMEKEITKNANYKKGGSEGKYEDIEQNGNVNNTMSVTIRRFMKTNTVIHWKPDVSTNFQRALYVALPKVKSPTASKCEQDNEMFEIEFEPDEK